MENSCEVISFDYAMKHVLKQKDYFSILEGFLLALLKEEVTIMEILDNDRNSQIKLNRVSLFVKNQHGKKMIVKIQYGGGNDYLSKILWDTCKTIVDVIPVETFVKVVSISLLYFNIGSKCIYKSLTDFYDLDADSKLFIEEDINLKDICPEYYLININRFNDIIETDLDEWLYMLKNNHIKDDSKSKNIDIARQVLAVSTLNSEQKRKYDSFMKEKSIERIQISVLEQELEQKENELSKKEQELAQKKNELAQKETELAIKKAEIIQAKSGGKARGKVEGLAQGIIEGKAQGIIEGKAQGIAEGKAQGIAEGVEQEKMQLIKRSLKKGLSVKTISIITELPLTQIQEISDNLKKIL
ncbi:hypothetical protein AN641_01960 [Candidatus Epulonipiscioides gigas]|nr:hypothetical protein AN641_01960 [Epulopiscium sp. SCG-C07WGA-EpuloA2]